MKFLDLHIYDQLFSLRNRWGFAEYIDRDGTFSWDGTPEMKVKLLSEIKQHATFEEKDEKSAAILTLEMDLLPVLVRMQETGITIDRIQLHDIWLRLDWAIARIEGEVKDLVWEWVNLASPKQIAELLTRLGIALTKKNKTGYSVDTDVLEFLAPKYDIARLILEHRSLSKLRSTYIDTLLHAIDSETQKIHTHYNQIGAATGRMSSENPNLQNIPTGGWYAREIKSCFLPSPWNILIVADYSQIELRILAILSWDLALTETFIREEDIHARTARFLFWNDTSITSEMRRIAKTVNFGVIYGITGFWLAKSLGTSPREATEYIENFFHQYTAVQSYYDTLLERARQNGYVETYFWRRRVIPSLHDANRMVRAAAEREAINMPIQGTAADMLKYAMVEIDRAIQAEGLEGRMLLQIHDELVFDVPLSEEARFREIIREKMEHTFESRVPIRVDIHSGKNWAEAKG